MNRFTAHVHTLSTIGQIVTTGLVPSAGLTKDVGDHVSGGTLGGTLGELFPLNQLAKSIAIINRSEFWMVFQYSSGGLLK